MRAQRAHELLRVTWLKHTCAQWGGTPVLWPPVRKAVKAFGGKLSWETVEGAACIIFCRALASYIATKAHGECAGTSRGLRAPWRKAGAWVVVGCELFRRAVPVWPSRTQPCWLGSAVQPAARVHQRSHASCFCGVYTCVSVVRGTHSWFRTVTAHCSSESGEGDPVTFSLIP